MVGQEICGGHFRLIDGVASLVTTYPARILVMYIVVLALNEEMLSHEFSISFALYKVVGTKYFYTGLMKWHTFFTVWNR